MTNSGSPDQTLRCVAYYMGLHCLPTCGRLVLSTHVFAILWEGIHSQYTCIFVYSYMYGFVWFNSFVPSTIFLGWTSTKLGLMCLAQGHNSVTPVRLEPASPRSRVKHSTNESLRSPYMYEMDKYSKTCLKRPLSKEQKLFFWFQLSLNAGQKHCRMLQGRGFCNPFSLHADLCFVYFWVAA